jgi:hypothetical protein
MNENDRTGRETGSAGGGIERRNVLKGTLLGVAGAGLGAFSGPVSARGGHEKDGRRDGEKGLSTITLKALTDRVEYSIEVSGTIAFGDEAGENDHIDDGDTVDGLITGKGGVDDYHYSGVVTDFEVREGKATVLVNGEAVTDPVGLPARRNRLVLEALTDRVEYSIEVSGQIAFGDEAGENDHIDDGDTVDGLITGKGGVDDYYFTGVVTDFEITVGDAAVSVNGEAVTDPTGLPKRPNRLVLWALTDRVEYGIEVSGQIAFGDEAGENDHIDDGDTVDGLIAGKGGVDDYSFTGSSVTVEITKGVAVFVVSDVYGGDDALSNTVTVIGQGPAVKYAFAVTGRVEAGAGVEREETDIPADRVGDRAVKGFVDAGEDEYRYSGAIKCYAQAPVAVTLELGQDT